MKQVPNSSNPIAQSHSLLSSINFDETERPHTDYDLMDDIECQETKIGTINQAMNIRT